MQLTGLGYTAQLLVMHRMGLQLIVSADLDAAELLSAQFN
jgi:hypothetical protein